jgi:hypothetical protein
MRTHLTHVQNTLIPVLSGRNHLQMLMSHPKVCTHQNMSTTPVGGAWSAPASARPGALGNSQPDGVVMASIEESVFGEPFGLSDTMVDAGGVASWGDPLQSQDTMLGDSFLP